ncbi:methyltransferase [Kribbella antibiotica]|uniref:methyltransferase n=1 Tax=Kribbella antibiotica TaxID=190195 RepID=UPI00192D4FF0|nr:class I SAM-dependent methyltransferase [Kribbella antibiotica]
MDDTTSADRALRLIRQGSTLRWEGDFHNARQLLAALGRRTRHVQHLNALLITTNDYAIRLRRAPDVAAACREAYGPPNGERLIPLRELLGVIGAHQHRKRGIYLAALNARIHPHYGVFAPTRSEYVDLVAAEPLPPTEVAFDLGTGTGVLAAVLLRRGITKVVATDNNPRAVACARENLRGRAEVIEADLFPPGRADLVVCNPPWVPGRVNTMLDTAVYDEDSRMLRGFLRGVGDHLTPDGEAWLVMGIRPQEEMLAEFRAAGLRVLGRTGAVPTHRRARSDETTYLWRLRPSDANPFVEKA